ncbi:30S ribosomal protein S6 modification protein [Vibrio ziniensis]|uniref:30S ribosomal protein S6 modification protein n=1 Tax=Vibrio ziniensis TaxID=2711221 RepID=A0A6G7CIP9_9VIBR|nr:30S ribosomal protein S6 modification protein [Vibrio ziniensis]QIH41979.1 30S ribosomal protein S6 modification protein [Vibrio ziniensis]
MFSQSKILVWYEVASQKVILGEALTGIGEDHDVVSLWRHAPVDTNSSSYPGYRLSLYDDDGREIGHKSVSMGTADEILFGMNKARV